MAAPTDHSDVVVGEALELLNEGLTPYLRTSCKLYGISWTDQPVSSSPPAGGLGWDPQVCHRKHIRPLASVSLQVLLSSLDTVVQNWDSIFQNMLQPSFLHIIPEICAALDRSMGCEYCHWFADVDRWQVAQSRPDR